MTTHEENLKKLNEEPEVLSNEELDQVAGGSYVQLSDDSKLLYDYGMVNKYYEPRITFVDYSDHSGKVDAGWKKAGITCVSKYSGSNLYFMKDTGKQISWSEARAHLRNNFKQVRSTYLDRF